MSRSYRKQPVLGYGGVGERFCRKQDIRRRRRTERARLHRAERDADVPRLGQHPDRDVGRGGRVRFDPRRRPALLRK